jgi:hypothetical protein
VSGSYDEVAALVKRATNARAPGAEDVTVLILEQPPGAGD